jgi:hypothetical protein
MTIFIFLKGLFGFCVQNSLECMNCGFYACKAKQSGAGQNGKGGLT